MASHRVAGSTGCPPQGTAVPAWREIHAAVAPCFHLPTMLIEAALYGQGVALVPRLRVETELAQGRAPWPPSPPIATTFCLVLPEPLGRSEAPLQAFVSGILAEAQLASSA